MTIDEAKHVLSKMGFTPGKVDITRGWLHVWSEETDPRTNNFLACVSYDRATGHITENRLFGRERYYRYDNGEGKERSLH